MTQAPLKEESPIQYPASLQSLPSQNELPPNEQAYPLLLSNASMEFKEEIEEIEIVPKERRMLNEAEIMQLYKERMQKEEGREKKERQKRRLEKTKQEHNPQPTTFTAQIRSKQKAKCEHTLREYRMMYRPSSYDTRLSLFRYECKEKTFAMLCLAVEELRDREQHAPLLTLSPRSLFNHLKRMALEIDLHLKTINKDLTLITKPYKEQWDCFLSHLQQETNEELRRKVLLREMPFAKIATAHELEFMTTEKREQIIQKDKRYLAEFSVEVATVRPTDESFVDYDMKTYQAAQVKDVKYIEPTILEQLQQYIGLNQITKMKNRLEQDLVGKSKENLIRNFERVFKEQ